MIIIKITGTVSFTPPDQLYFDTKITKEYELNNDICSTITALLFHARLLPVEDKPTKINIEIEKEK